MAHWFHIDFIDGSGPLRKALFPEAEKTPGYGF